MKGGWGRYVKGAAFGTMGFCTSWAVDVYGGGQEWIEVVEVDLPLKRLGEKFRGKRIVHVSDLHCSPTVSSKYLGHCVDRINQLEGDIVVLTGDYITYDYSGRFRRKVADLVGSVRSRHGVYACLGNHDYGIGGMGRSRQDEALNQMIAEMEGEGVNVLRNESKLLEIGGDGLWFVGLGDLWAGDLEPGRAFADVNSNDAVIALAHNPESIVHLQEFACDAVMSGHTHGVGIEWNPRLKRPIVNRRPFRSGFYRHGDKKLYVNRGLGRLGKLIFNTRPEITVFSLC